MEASALSALARLSERPWQSVPPFRLWFLTMLSSIVEGDIDDIDAPQGLHREKSQDSVHSSSSDGQKLLKWEPPPCHASAIKLADMPQVSPVSPEKVALIPQVSAEVSNLLPHESDAILNPSVSEDQKVFVPECWKENSDCARVLAKLRPLQLTEKGEVFQILARNPAFVADAVFSAFKTGIDRHTGVNQRRAYFLSITKLFDSLCQRSVSIGCPVGYNLTHAVKQGLEDSARSGFCTCREADELIRSKLRILPEKCALRALERLLKSQRASIRNLGNLLTAVMKDVLQDELSPPDAVRSQRHTSGVTSNDRKRRRDIDTGRMTSGTAKEGPRKHRGVDVRPPIDRPLQSSRE